MSGKAAPWQVAPLQGKAHDRTSFSCGTPELDRYIRQQATQDIKRNVARVFVATGVDQAAVCGYYSLSAASFQRDKLPQKQARRLPHYPVPSVLLGRLAIDQTWQGQGLGAFLLMDAMYRALMATQAVAMHSLVVDAKNDRATAFYKKYGFIPLQDDHRRLFLPMATIQQLLEP